MKNTFIKMWDKIGSGVGECSIVIQLYFYGFISIFTNKFDRKRTLLEDYYARWYTAEGRRMLAISMAVPIRRALDYQAIGRSLFMVAELPQGAYAMYEKVLTDFLIWYSGEKLERRILQKREQTKNSIGQLELGG